MKFKIFIALGLVSYAIAQGYMWSHDTTFTQEKDKIVENVSSYVTDKKNNAINSTKEAVKDGFDTSLKKIGIRATTEENKEKIQTSDKVSPQDNAPKDNNASFAWKYQVAFKYDHTGAPEGLSQDNMLEMIKNASNVWEKSCGIKFKMIGNIRSDYIATDKSGTSNKDFGIIRWSELGGDTLGQAHLGGTNGPVGDFILDINEASFSNKKGQINKESLQAVLVHELGHVIGLDHSRLASSVMHFQQRSFNDKLNEGDSQMCQDTISQWDKNPSNKKFKI